MRSVPAATTRVGLPTAPLGLTNVPFYTSGHTRTQNLRCNAVPDWMKNFFDFGNWAPRSTRIWRLQQYEYPDSKPDEVDELEAKINKVTRSMDEESRRSKSPGASTATANPLKQSSLDDDDGQLPATGSFSDAEDSDLAKALSQRIQSISSVRSLDEDGHELEPYAESSSLADEQGSAAVSTDTMEVKEDIPPLTGPEMRQLILTKYGKQYDCSFVRRDIPGKTFVCLNIMKVDVAAARHQHIILWWQHLEQRSFRLTPEQYEEKTDSIAYLINVLGQTKKVRSVLQAKARSEKGLPKRPVVGTAISIQLDLEPEVIAEFFGKGYQ